MLSTHPVFECNTPRVKEIDILLITVLLLVQIMVPYLQLRRRVINTFGTLANSINTFGTLANSLFHHGVVIVRGVRPDQAFDLTGELNLVTGCGSDKDFPFGNGFRS